MRPGSIVIVMVGAVAALSVLAVMQIAGQLRGETESPGLTLGEDGLPTSIAGEPVLTGAAVTMQIESATEPAPFLVTGWVLWLNPDCQGPPDAIDLEDPCGAGPYLLPSRPTVDSLDEWSDWPHLVFSRLAPENRDRVMGNGPFVFRVHTRDPDARLCPLASREECESALVVREVVLPR